MLARWAFVAVPTLLALVLGAVDLDGRSISLDEAATASITAQHRAARRSGRRWPATAATCSATTPSSTFSSGGSGTAFCAAPALGDRRAATTALVVVLARRWFSRRVALVAGLFSAVSLPAVYWGQNARTTR